MTYVPTGVDIAARIYAKGKPVLDYYDPDIDGAISGEFIRRKLERDNRQYMYYINENRTHGFRMTPEQVARLRGALVILVDAAMTLQEVEYLTAQGVDVINIDHHDIKEAELVYVRNDQTGCEGVIINNQYPFEPDEFRFLSGAGVVYYVLQALDPDLCGLEEKALVGLSLLSDIRPLENDIAYDFLHTTYTHTSPMINYLLKITKNERDYGFGEVTFDRNYIDYTFSPKVNALFRMNRGDEAISLFQGKYDDEFGLDVYRRIQNAVVDTIIENLQGEELSNLTYKYVSSDIRLNYQANVTNFIGLACSRVKNSDKTAMLFVREGNRILRGSVRGLCDDVDYLSIFRKHGFQAEGHQNAFGIISVDEDRLNLDALNAEIAQAEEGYSERKYKDRILECSSLSFFLNSRNVQLADRNNYVRDRFRFYLKYTGLNYEKNDREKFTEFIIDGVKVLSFEPGLTPENGLLLPIKERGSYVNFYLKPY